MTQFFPGDMVDVMERGRVRAVGRICARSCWSRDNEPVYLILPEGQMGLANAIAAHHDELKVSVKYMVANENFRAAEGVM